MSFFSVISTHHHDPDQEESVCSQQDHDGQLVGVEVDLVFRHEGAGEDSLQSVSKGKALSFVKIFWA